MKMQKSANEGKYTERMKLITTTNNLFSEKFKLLEKKLDTQRLIERQKKY